MSFFQSSDIKISSGYSGLNLSTIQMVQGINTSYSITREDIDILGSTKSLRERQILNYVPVKYNIDLIKSDLLLEDSLGLTNPLGIAMNIANSKDNIGFGSRNIYADVINEETFLYEKRIQLNSGVLQNYSISTSIGETVKVSMGGEATDLIILPNISQYNSYINKNIIKPDDILISGIQFSGMGISGLSIQSIDLSINFGRESDIKYGKIYPTRSVVSADASLTINGFIENFEQNSGILSSNNGFPQTGSYYITLNPKCSSYQSTTYKIINPYFENYSLGMTIGSFTAIQLGFSIPLPFSSKDIYNSSNIVIL